MSLIRIDLSEQLAPGQFVEIRNPKLLPWGVQRKLQESLKDQSVESQIAFAEKLAVELIRNGNVTDENGTGISFPLTAEAIENVPAVVIESVAVEFAKAKSKGADLPKN